MGFCGLTIWSNTSKHLSKKSLESRPLEISQTSCSEHEFSSTSDWQVWLCMPGILALRRPKPENAGLHCEVLSKKIPQSRNLVMKILSDLKLEIEHRTSQIPDTQMWTIGHKRLQGILHLGTQSQCLNSTLKPQIPKYLWALISWACCDSRDSKAWTQLFKGSRELGS